MGYSTAAMMYSGNSANTRGADISKILQPLETKMYQTSATVDWDAFVVLAQFACIICSHYFKDDLLNDLGAEIEACTKSHQTEKLAKTIELCLQATATTKQDNDEENVVLAKKAVLYTASLPAQLQKKPLYFYNAKHMDDYLKTISDVIILLEKNFSNVSWLDRLEKAITIQLKK